MKHPLVQVAVGSLIGLALGAALIYGMVQVSFWIMGE